MEWKSPIWCRYRISKHPLSLSRRSVPTDSTNHLEEEKNGGKAKWTVRKILSIFPQK